MGVHIYSKDYPNVGKYTAIEHFDMYIYLDPPFGSINFGSCSLDFKTFPISKGTWSV